jgi:hypothetical protein
MFDDIIARSTQSSQEMLECCTTFSEKALTFAKSVEEISILLHSVETSLLPETESKNPDVALADQIESDILLATDSSRIFSCPNDTIPREGSGSRSRHQHRPGSELLWPKSSEQVCQYSACQIESGPDNQDRNESDQPIDDNSRMIAADVGHKDLAWYESQRHVLDEALRIKGASYLLMERNASADVGGLVNQGATCYLNSLLQMLYAVPEFRHFAYHGWEYDPAIHGPPAVCIPLQLRLLFARMQVCFPHP